MFSEEERLDFYMCYIKNHQSFALTVREYRARYPERRIPDRKIIARIEHDLRNNFVLKYKKRNKPRNILTENTQLNIACYFENTPENSLRDASRDLGIAKSTIRNSLTINRYKPFKFAKLHHLEPNDRPRRLEFCMALMDRYFDGNVFERICWTDEATFTTAGIFNRKNSHYWSRENKKKIKTIKHQGRRSIHVWCGIYKNQIKGPLFMEGNLNRQGYLNLLQEEILPMLEADGEVNEIIYQMDGAPYHNGEEVRQFVNNNFSELIGPNGNVQWPPRSPDLTPLDYFLWGTLKNKVYQNRCEDAEQLKDRIRQEIQFLNESGCVAQVTRKLAQIYTTCIAENGGHVENLI